jgi:alpha-L-fucosidase
LLNAGPKGNGELKAIDKGILQEIGKWIKVNKNFIYNVKNANIQAENADVLQGEDCYYAVIKNVPVWGDPNVQRAVAGRRVEIGKEIAHAEWLDNGQEIQTENGGFNVEPFPYGHSFVARVAKFTLKN